MVLLIKRTLICVTKVVKYTFFNTAYSRMSSSRKVTSFLYWVAAIGILELYHLALNGRKRNVINDPTNDLAGFCRSIKLGLKVPRGVYGCVSGWRTTLSRFSPSALSSVKERAGERWDKRLLAQKTVFWGWAQIVPSFLVSGIVCNGGLPYRNVVAFDSIPNVFVVNCYYSFF